MAQGLLEYPDPMSLLDNLESEGSEETSASRASTIGGLFDDPVKRAEGQVGIMGRQQEVMDVAKELQPITVESVTHPDFAPYAGEENTRGLLDKYDVKIPIPDRFPLDPDMEDIMVPEAARDAKMEFANAPGVQTYDVVNFLFGGEMAVAGIRYDDNGFIHDWEIAKQQWSEEPLWLNLLNTTSIIGTGLFPAAKAVTSSVKFGKAATLLARAGGISAKDEWVRFAKLGLAEDGAEITTKALETLRRQEHYLSGYQKASKLAEREAAGDPLGVFGRMQFEFQKRFANDYFKIVNSMVDGEPDVKANFYKNLNELFKAENIGELFQNMPDTEDAGRRIYAHLLTKMDKSLMGRKVQLSAQELKWADLFEARLRQDQSEMLAEGLITPETAAKVGEMHIPAFYKGTPEVDLSLKRTHYLAMKGKKATDTVLRPFHMPRLDSPSLMTRQKDLPEVYEALMKGELLTGTADLTARSVVMHSLLKSNYRTIREIAMDSRYSHTAEDVIAKFGSAKKAERAGFKSLDTLAEPIKNTVKRMIEKKNPGYLGKTGELPYVRKAVFEDLFGEHGLFHQSQTAVSIFDLLTTIHKTSKTALSVPTHFQNLASNIAFMSQAGFNFLAPENLGIAKQMGRAFSKIAEANEIAKATGKAVDYSNLGVSLGKIKVGKKTFDLNEELLNPQVRELIEESAFENVEGFAHLQDMLERMGDGHPWLKGTAKAALSAKRMSQVPINGKERFKWFDAATKAYLAEDMIPKMTHYLGLRAQGLTRNAAILEVGRRLPMYKTVGSAVKWGRKHVFPWATFPVEAMRITKNNVMDHPLRMLPWLHLPGIMQSALAATGVGPESRTALEEAKLQLPLWAQTNTTTVMPSQMSAQVGGVAGGALTGGAAGTLLGGAPGAVAGAVVGGAAGYALSNMFPDKEQEDRMRGVVLDWLPHSSLQFTSTSPHVGTDTLPWQDIQGMMGQVPAQPLAILRPIVEVMSGRTAFGEEIKSTGPGDEFGRSIAGMLGFLAPPFIQKYGLKTTTPDISATQWLTGEPIAGDITNISRMLLDTGVKKDAVTGRPESFTNEFFLKNFSIWKSWATDPANEMTNMSMAENHFKEARTLLKKNLSFYLANGMDKEAVGILMQIMGSHTKQHIDNPRKAQAEYTKDLKRIAKAIGKHPRLRTWSQEEIEEKLEEVSRFTEDERGNGRDKKVEFLRGQVAVSRIKKMQERRLKEPETKTPFEKYQERITKNKPRFI